MEMNISRGPLCGYWLLGREPENDPLCAWLLKMMTSAFWGSGFVPLGCCLLLGWTVGLISPSLILGLTACASVSV